MDIKPLLTPEKKPTAAVSKANSLNLKLNQQLEVKVISSEVKTQSVAVEISSSKQPLHLQSNQSFESKSGQTLNLVVTKLSPTAEFKILNDVIGKSLNKESIVLKQAPSPEQLTKVAANVKNHSAPIISAKILAISNDTIQLKLYTSPSVGNAEYSKQKNPVISLTKEQLIPTDSKSSKLALQQNLLTIANFKPGQTIQLEVNKSGLNPEFKIADNSKFNLLKGQVITATVIGFKNSQVQLQISFNKGSSVITLDRQLVLNSMASEAKSQSLPLGNIKQGQKIQLEVLKTAGQTEFRPLPQTVISEQRILDSVKQLLPIQQQPSELINQLADKLPFINQNENIPDALKRLAKEILNNMPQLREVDHKQLKKLFSQSGLFLEAKLAQSAENKNINIDQSDFKHLLLKFQQALKQELDNSKESKVPSAEVNLLKEMQQKTESSLAKIILNQFASLPKEDSTRQVWMLDLPFMDQKKAETVRVEIDREQWEDTAEERESWTVTVIVTPQASETIYCKISCFDQTINTVFWSDNEVVVDEIDQHLDYLKTQLEKSGLNPGHMSANKGIPPAKLLQQIKGKTLFDQKV
jgi:hypothetical protein